MTEPLKKANIGQPGPHERVVQSNTVFAKRIYAARMPERLVLDEGKISITVNIVPLDPAKVSGLQFKEAKRNYDVAKIQLERKDYGLALATLGHSITLNPMLTQAYCLRSYLLFKIWTGAKETQFPHTSKFLEKAIQDLDNAIELDPQNAGIYRFRSLLNNAAKRFMAAGRDEEKAEEIEIRQECSSVKEDFRQYPV